MNTPNKGRDQNTGWTECKGGKLSSARVIRVGRYGSKGQKIRACAQVTLDTMCQSFTCSSHCLNRLKLLFLQHRELPGRWGPNTTTHLLTPPNPQTPHPAKVNTGTISKHMHNTSARTYESIRQTLVCTTKPVKLAFIVHAHAQAKPVHTEKCSKWENNVQLVQIKVMFQRRATQPLSLAKKNQQARGNWRNES